MKTWHDRINDPRGNDDGPHIDTQSIPGKVCGVCDCKDAGGRDDQHLVNCGSTPSCVSVHAALANPLRSRVGGRGGVRSRG